MAGQGEIESLEKKMLSDGEFLSEVERIEVDLIEEYLDKLLSPQDMKDFQANFLAAPERKATYRFMLALREKASERAQEKSKTAGAAAAARQSRRGIFLNDWYASGLSNFVALGCLLITIGIGSWWYFSADQSDGKLSEGLAALNTAYLKQRPTEVRLSALDYAPNPTTRGDQPLEVDSGALDQAGLLLWAAEKESPGAESYRALGLYYISKQEPDKANKYFEQGLSYKPADARFYADYGAMLLETAKTSPNNSADARLRLLETSLLQLDKALKLNSEFLPALFNKALCLQDLNSFAAARDTWKKYLEKDTSSPWAREAREQLRLLDEKDISAKSASQVLEGFMQAFQQGNESQAWKIAADSKEMVTGTMVSEQLSRGLLSADAQGAPEDANRMLSALNFLGQLEKKNAGDIFFADLADYYSRTSHDQRLKLNEAQLLTQEGYVLCLKAKYTEALEKFRLSRELFANAGNLQEAVKTDYWISYCKAEESLEESLKLAGSVADYSRSRSYKWLLGQALTQTSSAYGRYSKFSPAIRYAREALGIAKETADAYNRQKTYSQLTDAYTQLNEPAGALENSQNSLREIGTYFNSPRQTWRNYMFASQVSYRFGLGESAVAYAQEGVRLSREKLADPAAISNSYSLLSGAYRAIKNYDDALNAAEEGIKISLTFDPGQTQKRLLADSLLQKAEAQRPLADCPAAVATYDQASSLFAELGWQETVKNYNALKGKLICQKELGDDQKVEESLPAVLHLAETLRGEIEEEEAKTSFFADEQSIYELAAAHALKNNNAELAFEYIEKGKARSLLDDLRRQGPPSPADSTNVLTLEDIRRQLPAGSQLVQYSILPDRVLIWAVSDSGTKFAEKSIRAAELESLVRDLRGFVSSANADRVRMNDLEAQLYALLIQPVQPFLDKNKEIVIVPDKILCYLPFEALRSPAGKYAVQDYQLSYSPSATLFVMLSRQAAKRAALKGEEEFLGIGNPSFDRSENPKLKNLSDAESEIRSSAAFYRLNRQLIGPDAKREAVLAALPRSDIFHFAGHYKANDISPRFSKLLLSGKSPGGDDLTAAEISGLKLNRTRLVILSACKTAIENYYHGEGAIGIARTFFAAGAPTVIASRWEVDSSAAAQLMTNFHHYRKDKKLSTSAALRAAQLDMLNSESSSLDSPFYWAAFAVVGGTDKM